MGVTHTIQGDNLTNYPDREPSAISPNDLILTDATPQQVTFSFERDGLSLATTVSGVFEIEDVSIGMGLGVVSEQFAGQYTQEVIRFESPEAAFTETLVYDTPVDIEPVTDLTETFATLSARYAGNDVFIGDSTSPSSDDVRGYGGNDRFVMTYGDRAPDRFRGDAGIDTAVMGSAFEDWGIETSRSLFDPQTGRRDLSGFLLTDLRVEDPSEFGGEGHQLALVEVERLEFTDTKLALDFDRGENGYKAAALITTLFGSEMIPTYFAPAIGLIDQGQTEIQIAQLVIDLGLFEIASNESFVDTIYTNVVGSSPDALTQAIYVNQLESGDVSHAQLTAMASGAPILESQISEIGVWRESGLDFVGF